VYRAQKQVGETPRTVYRQDEQAAERHAQNDDLAAAIKLILKQLPDLIYIGDVLAVLPPEAIEPVAPTRRPMAVSIALGKLGIHSTHKTTPINGRMRLYIVRRRRRYDGMTAQRLVTAKEAMGNGRARANPAATHGPREARQAPMARRA
jgi:hypothetical protein